MTTPKTLTTAALVAVGTIAATLALPVVLLAGLNASADLSSGGGLTSDGIPPVVADAYRRAAAAAGGFEPSCAIPAWILAGVGHVESGHGTHNGATSDPSGIVAPPIIGPALPSLGADTDAGEWDGDPRVDHAVGPMQFIPATWRAQGLDANGDGTADPHNIYDATLTAAAYLCDAGTPMATDADWRRGLFAYNHSHAYVEEVLAAAARYRPTPGPNGTTGITGAAGLLVDVVGIGPTNATWASQVRALVAAAAADGVTLTGSSYRSPARQIALRRAHCGTSHYAIYLMPASQCSPPTARPGTSRHEQGLAIDFHHCSTRATRCYRWLATNASRFRVFNLPSEPWHWSVDGK